ncbi:MAG: hypothetical protein AAFW69_08330 [Pseudomonadota bacterium]
MSDGPGPRRGVLVRARNGDVVAFDETGLRMRLSDEVIRDIAARLPDAGFAGGAGEEVPPAVLGDLDAWSVTRRGGDYAFTARMPGAEGARRYLRPVDMETALEIIAEPTELSAILSLSGARRAEGGEETLAFPWHVVTAGDHLGPAGAAGTEPTRATDRLHRLGEQTRDSLIADAILARRARDFRRLPTFFVRCEADESADAAAWSGGAAWANFEQSARNLAAAGARLALAPRVQGVALDFTLEDVVSGEAEWLAAMRAAAGRIAGLFDALRLGPPRLFAIFDAGDNRITDGPVLRAQWRLAWEGAGMPVHYTAPGYMFVQDSFGRHTPAARRAMAEMEAEALEVLAAGGDWRCPLPLLAEREGDPAVIRCRTEAMGPLTLDPADPLGAGPAGGFRLEGVTNGAAITGVAVARDDPKDVLITCDRPPEGVGLTLLYALGAPAVAGPGPANRGALRDGWGLELASGETLRRWALPAALPVH